MDKKNVKFSDLINQKQWQSYEDYRIDISDMIKDDVKKDTDLNRNLVEDVRKSDLFKKCDVRDVAPQLEDAEKDLFAGNVVGIDGTMAKYKFSSGYRCQIGIVAVNHLHETIKKSFFISAADLRAEPQDILDRINARAQSTEELSDMALRGLMMFREREAGLREEFKGRFIMYHGPLLPFELRMGLGRLRALGTTLPLLEKVVSSRKAMSIISSARSNQHLLWIGRAIKPGQYATADNFTAENEIKNEKTFTDSVDKWRSDELEKVNAFLSNYAKDIKIGVIRMASAPYVFQAHKDIFDRAAGIIARDSMLQPEKGFPLLVDYADNLAGEYFSNSDYSKLIEWELAKNSSYLEEVGERRMRVK